MPNTIKRKRARTSVPEDQLEIWDEEAEEMDLTRAEYIRLMIQAGRRQFPVCDTDESDESEGINIEARVLDALREHGELTWDELDAEVIGDLEQQVEQAVDDLEDEGMVETSLRDNTVSLR